MGSHFPLEILFQIAEFIEPCKRTPFTPYTLVCRRWQAAFEPLIYKQLSVCSDGFGVASGTLSLSQFQSMTSGAASRISRRYMVQSISYWVAVPYKLMDYRSIVPADGLEHYKEDNTVRNSNDEAFKNGMADLFNTLASWSGDHQFSLSLRVMGRKKMLEPGTRDILSADEEGRIKDGDTVVQPYRARFPDGKCELRDVTCIRELIFSSGHWIWVGAAMHIARCCTRLDGLFWDTYEFVKRDNLHYMQARRQAFADGLPHLPGTLKRLEYTNAAEGPYRASRPSLASEGVDLLSLNLQWMSTRLEELRLSGVFVSPEFLWPLDEQAKPIRTHIEWPNLRVLVVKQGQRFILSDTPEFELMYLAFGRREILNMRDIPSYKPSNKFSETDAELCHRAMISMGCAVHHMPRLQTINYDFPVNIFASFRLARDHEACSFQAAWMFDDEGCKPDHRVASAWGFSLGSLKTTLAPGFGTGLRMLYEVDYRM